MGTPVRTTNRRGKQESSPAKITRRKTTIRLALDPEILDIAADLAKAVAGFIDAYAADVRSKTSIEQTKFANNIEMRRRVFELVAPKVRTVGGMAPLGRPEDKP